MSYLEKVKAIVQLSKLEKSTSTVMASKYINLAKSSLESEWGIDLNSPDSTTPKKLFGKTYREMDKDEIAEYSQIKRLIRRNSNGE